jgi:hypothetical protein
VLAFTFDRDDAAQLFFASIFRTLFTRLAWLFFGALAKPELGGQDAAGADVATRERRVFERFTLGEFECTSAFFGLHSTVDVGVFTAGLRSAFTPFRQRRRGGRRHRCER